MPDDEWIQIGPYRMTPEQVDRLLGERSGLGLWALEEAAWSVKMSRDPRAQTYAVEDDDDRTP